jgi:hypothetical protein
MFYFHCTKKLAKSLKVSLIDSPMVTDGDWLDCRYVREIPLELPLDTLVFTTAATNYSLVHPFDRRESIDEIVLVFQQRLAWLTGKIIPKDPESYQIDKTAFKRVIGCMNEQVQSLLYIVKKQLAGEGVQFEKIEEYLNSGISGGLFPQNEFRKRLDANLSPNTSSTRAPHLSLVSLVRD